MRDIDLHRSRLGSVHIELHPTLITGVGGRAEAFLDIDLAIQFPGIIKGHILQESLYDDPTRRSVIAGAIESIEIVGVIGPGGTSRTRDAIGQGDERTVGDPGGELAFEIPAAQQNFPIPRGRISAREIGDDPTRSVTEAPKFSKIGHAGRLGGIDGNRCAIDACVVDRCEDPGEQHGSKHCDDSEHADHLHEGKAGSPRLCEGSVVCEFSRM